jgi:predicted small metal-binding protein
LKVKRARLYFGADTGHQELIMARKYIDCRAIPSATNCSVTIAADSEQELLEVAAQHAIAVHGAQDTPAFRTELKQAMREGSPPP